jgi:hypothetical protein
MLLITDLPQNSEYFLSVLGWRLKVSSFFGSILTSARQLERQFNQVGTLFCGAVFNEGS